MILGALPGADTNADTKERAMAGFGMLGKLVARPGRRDELLELLRAGTEQAAMDGCELYLINRAADDPDAIWVVEMWRDEAAHRASLELPQVRAAIERARPLIAGMDGVKLEPAGGVGLR
jgi:quinol monooxygenase YgiN